MTTTEIACCFFSESWHRERWQTVALAQWNSLFIHKIDLASRANYIQNFIRENLEKKQQFPPEMEFKKYHISLRIKLQK